MRLLLPQPLLVFPLCGSRGPFPFAGLPPALTFEDASLELHYGIGPSGSLQELRPGDASFLFALLASLCLHAASARKPLEITQGSGLGADAAGVFQPKFALKRHLHARTTYGTRKGWSSFCKIQAPFPETVYGVLAVDLSCTASATSSDRASVLLSSWRETALALPPMCFSRRISHVSNVSRAWLPWGYPTAFALKMSTWSTGWASGWRQGFHMIRFPDGRGAG